MRAKEIKKAESEQRHSNKIKSPFVSFFTTAIGVILMLSATFAFVIFKTDSFMVVDDSTVTWNPNRPSGITSMSVLMSQIEDERNDTGSVENQFETTVNTPGVTEFKYMPSSGDWYSTPPSYDRANVIKTIKFSGGEVSLYSSPPWSGATYIYNWTTAADDVVNQVNTQCGKSIDWKYAIAYESVGSSYATYQTQVQKFGDVNCLSVALPPAAVDPDYCQAFTRDTWYKDSTPDNSLYYGDKKFCVILEEKNNPGNYVYLPVFCGDSKGHTFPGGAIQTHTRLCAGSANADGPFSLQLGDYGDSGDFSWTAFGDRLDVRVSDKESAKLKEYFQVNLELCHANANDATLLNTYRPIAVIGF